MENDSSRKAVKKKGIRIKSDNLQAFLMILPFLAGFILFSYVPIIYILRYAFTDYTGFGDSNFTGLQNFVRVFKRDPDFWQSLVNTVLLSAGKLLVEIPLALLLAVFLNKKLKGMNFFRVTLFMPAVISAVIIGLIFSLMFASYNGMINSLLQNAGFIEKPINWFKTKPKAMLVLGIASVWQNYGINMVFFLMALQSIPEELYDCASIDGATGIKRFFKITLPMISSMFLVNWIYTIVDFFTKTDNQIMEKIRIQISTYMAFDFGSALAWIYFAVVMVMIGVSALIITRVVYYYE